MSDHAEDVERHYGRGGLIDRILAALQAAGKDTDRLTPDDLAAVDEFHSRRRLATEELAAMLAPGRGDRLLDVGSGLGGPARYLASVCGCQVSGVDLTTEFVETATELARRMGLSGQVDFRQGSALALPCGWLAMAISSPAGSPQPAPTPPTPPTPQAAARHSASRPSPHGT